MGLFFLQWSRVGEKQHLWLVPQGAGGGLEETPIHQQCGGGSMGGFPGAEGRS